MSSALYAAVTGLQSYQTMLDVAGNNLANVNTTGYKASTVTFSELLSETIKSASGSTDTTGGTNPQQVGNGVGVSTITKNMTQGSIVDSDNELDMAIDGEGFFVVSDGTTDYYTRVGTFTVDEDNHLVDSSTGYLVQRLGTTGESEGFQTSGDSSITIPYDTSIAASATTEITMSGNLSSDETLDEIQTNEMTSTVTWTNSDGDTATGDMTLAEISDSGTWGSATITISGTDHDGDVITDGGTDDEITIDLDAYATSISVSGAENLTLDQVADAINDALTTYGNDDISAEIVDGQLIITDTESGYSQTDFNIEFSSGGTADIEMPSYFEITTVGGEVVQTVDITIYDSLGEAHVLTAALVKNDDADDTWDLVVTSITGDVDELTSDGRRITGITFDSSDGSYAGLDGTDVAELAVTFENSASAQTIDVDLGTTGQMDGLTQFAGSSTAVISDQDGYESGTLSSLSVSSDGTIVGTFSNGVQLDIATIALATFQNSSGLEAVGDSYYIATANSGDAVLTQASTGSAGSISGNSLEQSNADVATEFVTLIQAQNGYQANARTIQVANEILQELTNLIR